MFFFSSRRRHTRCSRDWSSDVCSSDLLDIAYGITSRTPQQAGPHQVLKVNRGHWTIENSCHYIIDWNYDEDRSRIRTGHGPENITRLRRFAIGVLKSKGCGGVAQKMRSEERRVGKEGRFRGAPDH